MVDLPHGRYWRARFASCGGLVLRSGAKVSHDVLEPECLAAIQSRGGSRAGDRANRARLAVELPSSVFAGGRGGRPLFGADAQAHGTAMADMVLSTAPRNARLHAVELPAAAVTDITGGLMRGLLVPAVHGAVGQVDALRRAEGRDGRYALTLLLAFGFYGGPGGGADGSPEVLDQLRDALSEIRSQGVDVTLVLPVGNHRQAQGHAILGADEPMGWRLVPDDHSPNTAELIHPSGGGPLTLTAPDRSSVTVPVSGGLGRLEVNGRAAGAVWTRSLDGGLMRTRVTLCATAARKAGLPRAPFGLWQIALPGAEAWILRDETGFEPDPAAPARGSRFESRGYRQRDRFGLFELGDPGGASVQVLRAGTASMLAVAETAAIVPVGAGWREGAALREAPYSGGAKSQNPQPVLVDLATGAGLAERPIGPFGARAALGNGGAQRFRIAGTSVAAALRAGIVAGGVPDQPGSALA